MKTTYISLFVIAKYKNTQHCSRKPFFVVQATSAEFGLQAGNMKFNTQNEE